jgi:T5orf172 domain
MTKGVPTVPASPAILKELIPQILASGGPIKRDAIIARLRQIAPVRGFTLRPGTAATKKALALLLASNRVISPRVGFYALPPTLNAAPDSGTSDTQTEDPAAIEIALPQSEARKLEIQREIGEGPECVYVYFHDVYREVAQNKGLTRWECKVGCTVGEPDARIVGQGALTCFPRSPVIGLVIRTHDGRHLEHLIHGALSYAGAKVNGGGGSEWFLTSPALIERWLVLFNESLNTLLNESGSENPGL